MNESRNNMQHTYHIKSRDWLLLATPPFNWFGPDIRAFSSFGALLPYVRSRFASIWINPHLLYLPTPRDNIKELLNKLYFLIKKRNIQIVKQEKFVIIKPTSPYTEFYISPFKKHDNLYLSFWSIIAKTIVDKIESLLKSVKINFCLSTHIFGGLLGSIMKERNLIENHIYYDLDNFSKIPPFNKIPKQIFCLEQTIVQTADTVWSVSKTLMKLRKQMGAHNVIIVPNGVNTSLFAKAIQIRDVRKRSSKGLFSIVYTGSIHENWGVDTLLSSFERLIQEGYDIRLILAGPATKTLLYNIKVLRSKYQDRIKYLGVVNWNKLYKVLAMGDVGVAPYKTGGSAAYGTPLKIKEYIAAGLPVIATRIGEIPLLLKNTGAGITCGDSPKELSDTIAQFIKNSDLIKTTTKRARESKMPDWNNIYNKAFKITMKSSDDD